MANWLSRATSLFQKPPPPVQTFEVECDCGGKLSGDRTNTYQKPACPSCQRPMFVLPANVYPEPKSNLKKKAKKAAEDTNPSRPPAKSVVADVPPPPPGKPVLLAASKPVPAAEVGPEVEQFLRREPITLQITPLRMVATAIVIMSALTIGGLWNRHRVETAKATVAQSTDAGMAAIAANDFYKASVELGKAHAAVDVIGRRDEAANEIRRFSREATAMAKLTSSSLSEVIQETLGDTKPGKTSQPLRMSSVHRSAWIILDARLLPMSEGKNRYTIDAPLDFDQVGVRMEIETSIFRSVPKVDESGEPSRVIFAAQLEQLSSPSGDPPTSVLTLTGKTAFLWTHYDNYAAIGYRPFDDESERLTRAVLDRQLEMVQK